MGSYAGRATATLRRASFGRRVGDPGPITRAGFVWDDPVRSSTARRDMTPPRAARPPANEPNVTFALVFTMGLGQQRPQPPMVGLQPGQSASSTGDTGPCPGASSSGRQGAGGRASSKIRHPSYTVDI